MSFTKRFTSSFKTLLPHAGVLAFEVVGGVFSFFWAVIMLFSVFVAAGAGLVVAQDKVIPALGLEPGILATIVNGLLAFLGAFIAVIVVEMVEFILLVLFLLVIAGLIALIASAYQGAMALFRGRSRQSQPRG